VGGGVPRASPRSVSSPATREEEESASEKKKRSSIFSALRDCSKKGERKDDEGRTRPAAARIGTGAGGGKPGAGQKKKKREEKKLLERLSPISLRQVNGRKRRKVTPLSTSYTPPTRDLSVKRKKNLHARIKKKRGGGGEREETRHSAGRPYLLSTLSKCGEGGKKSMRPYRRFVISPCFEGGKRGNRRRHRGKKRSEEEGCNFHLSQTRKPNPSYEDGHGEEEVVDLSNSTPPKYLLSICVKRRRGGRRKC